MASITFDKRAAAGGSHAIMVHAISGADVGKVLDFADNTYKTIAASTTPYLVATERTDGDGTGQSSYTRSLDLALVNPLQSPNQYRVRWYASATPDNTTAVASEEDAFFCRFGMYGLRDCVVQCELGVKSTAGTTAQAAVWLECGGEKVDIDGVDAAATASIVVREHRSGSNLFTLNMTAADLFNDIFEEEQASPAFTDDRIYLITCTITLNSVAFVTTHARVVIG